jgi:hypothetical protein
VLAVASVEDNVRKVITRMPLPLRAHVKSGSRLHGMEELAVKIRAGAERLAGAGQMSLHEPPQPRRLSTHSSVKDDLGLVIKMLEITFHRLRSFVSPTGTRPLCGRGFVCE